MIDWSKSWSWVDKVLPSYRDPPERRTFKLVVLLIVGAILLMVVVSLTTFLLSVRGAEQVLVPAVEETQIIEALMELQEKELNARIQVRFSSDFEKGMVIEQRPSSGTVVRAGRRVTLTVSRGPVIDRVEDYAGWKLEDVRNHLQTIFASYRALLKIKEPVSYVFDEAPAGTVVAQKPPADTVIDSFTELELVVSRGPKGELVTVPDFTGLAFLDALAELSASSLPFVFSVRAAQAGEAAGVIVAQSPEPEGEIPYGAVVQLTMTRPARLPRGKVFGVFEYVLPDYPIMVDISLDAVGAGGPTTLVAMKHPGGPISIPYVVDEKSELVLHIFDKEEIRQQVGPGS